MMQLAAHAAFAVAAVWLIVVDLREHRLPNRLVGAATGVILALLIAASLFAEVTVVSGVPETRAKLLTSLVSAVAYGLVFLVLWLIAPNAIGAGDVKLAPLIGLMAGWSGLWVAALWVPLFIGVVGGLVGIVSRARRRKYFAFGPVMLGACWLGILLAGVGWIR